MVQCRRRVPGPAAGKGGGGSSLAQPPVTLRDVGPPYSGRRWDGALQCAAPHPLCSRRSHEHRHVPVPHGGCCLPAPQLLHLFLLLPARGGRGLREARQQDLVKNHLMYAVREEVEVLKEQIKELLEKNSQLERENSLLKTLASPEQLEKFQSRLPTEVLCPEEQSPGAPAPAQHAGGSAV
ncbi:TSC22 domain family protein 3 isoform X2 [Rhea pennata]|uniref:TSC22 domain family protein 3 isoform X2 n=1 Tax=Rhea pennata TaxID=8795 RepID=UPI002E276843